MGRREGATRTLNDSFKKRKACRNESDEYETTQLIDFSKVSGAACLLHFYRPAGSSAPTLPKIENFAEPSKPTTASQKLSQLTFDSRANHVTTRRCRSVVPQSRCQYYVGGHSFDVVYRRVSEGVSE